MYVNVKQSVQYYHQGQFKQVEYLYTLYMLYLIHVYIKIGVVIKPWKGKKTDRQTIIHKTQLHYTEN